MRIVVTTGRVAAFVIVCVAGLSGAATAQNTPPSTDVFLAPLTVRGTQITVGAPVNITHRPGYDNQPSFTPDGRAILFTSIHEDGQSDIYRFDLQSKTTSRVTTTPESEYSAQVMPGGRRFSVIRVEKDSTQRLWSFDLGGGDPRLVIEAVKPVGYHTWVDSVTLALFVLGQPNALVIARTTTSRVDTIARDIGRSLTTPPGRNGTFTFVTRGTDSSWTVTRGVRAAAGWRTEALVTLPRGAEYVAWAGADVAVTGTGTRIYVRPGAKAPWVEAADLGTAGLRSISRVAVSPDGKWLAFVGEPR